MLYDERLRGECEIVQVNLVRTNSCPKRLTTADLLPTMSSAVQNWQVQEPI